MSGSHSRSSLDLNAQLGHLKTDIIQKTSGGTGEPKSAGGSAMVNFLTAA